MDNWVATSENRSSGFLTRSDTNRAAQSLRWLEAWNFGFREKRDCTIQVVKIKVLISFAVTVFVFAYAKIRFPHITAQQLWATCFLQQVKNKGQDLLKWYTPLFFIALVVKFSNFQSFESIHSPVSILPGLKPQRQVLQRVVCCFFIVLTGLCNKRLLQLSDYNFQMKNSDVFGHWGILTDILNLCFKDEIRKNNVFPCKSQIYYVSRIVRKQTFCIR